MAIEILMPALSPTMETGTLATWNVAVGDAVRSGDVIAEIETDKATMEVEAVDDGVLAVILVEAGSENESFHAHRCAALAPRDTADGLDAAALDRSSVAVGSVAFGAADSRDSRASASNASRGCVWSVYGMSSASRSNARAMSGR